MYVLSPPVSVVRHGLDAHVAVQRVEEGKVEVVEVRALGGQGDHYDVEAVLGALTLFSVWKKARSR